MLPADYVDDILGSFRKQRLRTALTAAGIAIGAFAITLMIGLGQGLQSYIEEQFGAFNDDRVIMVFPAQARFSERIFERVASIGRPAEPMSKKHEEERRLMRGGLWITPEQVTALKKVDGVASVSPLTWLELDGVRVVGPDEPPAPAHEVASGTGTTGSASGPVFYETDFATLYTSPMVGTPSAGVLPSGASADEVVLAPQYAKSFQLDPEDLVGRTVELRVPKLSGVSQRFLFRDPSTFSDEHQVFRARVVGLAENSPFSKVIYPSIGLGRDMARYQSGSPDLLSESKIGFQAHVRITSSADVDTVKQKIRALDLVARTVNDQLADVGKVFLVVDAVLTSFGLLALLVATLGIANTLLMAITERTREIGVMKALGMTEGTIRRMFALEAAAIGLAGGVAGTTVAVALGLLTNVVVKQWVPAAANLEGYSFFYFPVWLFLGAPLFASLVGGLAGIYPAKRAARLDPIQALHHE